MHNSLKTREPDPQLVPDGPTVTDESKRGRGRPKKKRRYTPEVKSFDQIAEAIASIPAEGGAWIRAKEAAMGTVDGDKDLPQPSSGNLFRAILFNLNHRSGFDFHGRAFYAAKCGMDESTVRKRMAQLCDHGYVLRRAVSRPGQYPYWQTTLPVLVNVSLAAKRGQEANKTKPGGQVIEFPAASGRPTGLLNLGLVDDVEEVKSERAADDLKIDDGRDVATQSFLCREHFARFRELATKWSRSVSPAEFTQRFLRDLVELAGKDVLERDTRKALALTFALCEEEAVRPRVSQRGKLVSYFAITFEKQLSQLQRQRMEHEAALRYIQELKKAEHEAATRQLNIKLELEEGVKQRRLAALEDSIATKKTNSGTTRYGSEQRDRRSERGSRYVQNLDGRQTFNDDAKLVTIAFSCIAGVHGNLILDAAPGATVRDVESALVEVSATYPSPRQGVQHEAVTLKAILSDATLALIKKIAYRKHGTPEQLCGGKPARLEGVSPWFVISQDKVDAVKKACPLLKGSEDLKEVWMAVRLHSDKNRLRYGPTLQKELEEKFIELMEARQRNVAEARLQFVTKRLSTLLGARWSVLPQQDQASLVEEGLIAYDCGAAWNRFEEKIQQMFEGSKAGQDDECRASELAVRNLLVSFGD